MKLFVSRNFTEFGPFKATELEEFYQRGVLKDSDYARYENEPHWLPVPQLIKVNKITATPAKPTAPAKATPTAKPATTKKVTKKVEAPAWEKAPATKKKATSKK